MRWLVLAALASACNANHDPWPPFPGASDGGNGPPPLPDDPRLGMLVYTGLPDRVTVDATYADQVYVAIGELRDGDVIASTVIALGGDGTQPATVLPSYPAALGVSAGTAVLLHTRSGTEVWDRGPLWTLLPASPITNFGNARWIARAGNAIVVGPDAAGAVWFYNGTSWDKLALDVPAVAFGPWDDAGLRLLYSRNNDLCTALFALPALTPGAETCIASATPFFDALGGTTSDFTAIADGRLYHFDGAWTAGDFAPTDSRTAPYPGVNGVLQVGGSIDTTPGYDALAAGMIAGTITPPLPHALACTCDRTVDLACPCAPGVIDTRMALAPDRTRAAFVTTRSIDATSRVYVRIETLPLATVPFTEPYP